MSEIISWESAHEFYFSTSTTVTPASLAESLLGLDGVLKHTARVLGQLTGVSAKELEIELQKVEIGSYKDSFVFRMVFGTGKAAEKKVEKLRQKLRLNNMEPKHIVGLVIGGVILWTAAQYVKPADKTTAGQTTIIIENSFNNLSREVGLPPEDFKAVLDEALKGKEQQVKRDVIRLSHPDGHDTDGHMIIDNREVTRIPAEVLDVLPKTVEKVEPKERITDYIKKEIAIRALDLDRPQSGWAAIAPDAWDLRLPLIIGDEINPSSVPVGKYQIGDFSVVWKKDKKGNQKATKIILHRLYRN